MPALSVLPPFPVFADKDGTPLENGYIWVGTANLDPQGNQITIYWDEALTIPAAQPVRTIGGYPSQSGSPGALYAATDFSIRVLNKNGLVVYSAPTSTKNGVLASNVLGQLPLAQTDFTAAGTGAITRTGQNKARDTVSVFDYMTSAQITDVQTGSLSINVAPAIVAALASGAKRILFPGGKYRCDSTITLTGVRGLTLEGDAAAILAGGTGYSGNTELVFDTAPSGSDGIVATNFVGLMMENILIRMRRGAVGGGKALFMYNGHDYSLRNVNVDLNVGASGCGIQLGNGNGATSTFIGDISNVKVMTNASCPGIYANFGTSLTFTACYVIGGWMQFDGMTYSTVNSCAVDASALYGYIINGSTNMTFNACGAEGAQKGAFYFSTTATNHVLNAPYGADNNKSNDPNIGDLVHLDSSVGVVNSITITNPTSVALNPGTAQNIWASAGTGFVEVYNTDLTLFSKGFGGNATWIRDKLTVTGIWDQMVSWTPALSLWTNVGSPTVTGKYKRVGKVVTFYVIVTPATSISSTRVTSTITGFPFTSVEAGTAMMVDGNVNSYGVCIVGPGGIIYPQTTGVITVPVTIIGTVILP